MSADTAEDLDRFRLLKDLAQLSPIEYDQVRSAKAEELGCGVTALDAEVKQFRRSLEEKETEGSIPIEETQPYPFPVEGAQLYGHVKAIIERHMDLPAGAATTVALWVFGTYCYDQFSVFPKLLISSPEKECGKSTLMEIIESLTWRAYLTSNGTEAAIFRLIDVYHPALLLDETDRWVTRDKPGLIAVVNCGHSRRGAKVLRTVGDDHTPKNFSVWGPMALAGIKKPDDTIVSRSLQVELRRMPPGVRKDRTPIDLFERNAELRKKLLRWAKDQIDLRSEGVLMPAGGGSRERDNWSVMLKIANRLGAFDETVSAFHLAISKAVETEPTVRVMLLADLRRHLSEANIDKVFGADLVGHLTRLTDRPWADWRGGFTQNKLAKLLEPFEIKSRDVRIGGAVKRGYFSRQFEDAFTRYLPDTTRPSATTLQPTEDIASSHVQSATDHPTVAPSNGPNASNGAGCSTVAVQTPLIDCDEEWR